jgi:DnaJ homolog subfamily A member 2
MYVKFEIAFPPPGSIDAEKIKLLEQALPPRPSLPSLSGKEVEEVVLSNVDPMHEKKANYTEDDNMDEDEGHGHGPGVQCAQQ